MNCTGMRSLFSVPLVTPLLGLLLSVLRPYTPRLPASCADRFVAPRASTTKAIPLNAGKWILMWFILSPFSLSARYLDTNSERDYTRLFAVAGFCRLL